MYRRNQVEKALERATYGVRTSAHKAAAFRIRIKRLIETDRAMGADRRSHDLRHRQYAFFDEPPPGRGSEVVYSAFAVFALFLALRLMDAGLPQSEAVLFVRRIRPDLEKEHGRILAIKWEKLIDHRIANTIEDEVAKGQLVTRFPNMAFLVALPGQVTVAIDSAGKISVANIVRGKDRLTEVLSHLARWDGGGPIICIELVNPAHQLAYWLSKIEPIKRGRK